MTKTANQEFADRKAEALAALEKVRAEIEQMAQDQSKAPWNWGYVGSMGRIANVLECVK